MMSDSAKSENMDKQLWSIEKTVSLIQAYEMHPLLWNPREKLYKNKYKRNDAITDIASHVGCSVLEVKKKLESVLAQYRREKKNVTKSGMATSDRKKPWWGLKYLRFLDVKYVPNHTISNCDISESTEVDNTEKEISQPEVTGDQENGEPINDRPSSSHSHTFKLPPNKRTRKEKQDEAYNIMKECYQKINCTDNDRDEFSIYGEAVAARIRKLTNPVAICILKNKIDNAIFEAELEEYQKQGSYSNSVRSSSRNSNHVLSSSEEPISGEDSHTSFLVQNEEDSNLEENTLSFINLL